MVKESISIEIEAPSEAVFALIHDYDQRLEWDTMLSEATVLGEAKTAAKGVCTRCVGTWRSGWIPMDTVYVNFEPGRVAAVKLVNRPPFFDQFAATIRHKALSSTRSRLTYTYLFRARPKFLSFILEPLINSALRRETRGRLHALQDFMTRQQSQTSA